MTTQPDDEMRERARLVVLREEWCQCRTEHLTDELYDDDERCPECPGWQARDCAACGMVPVVGAALAAERARALEEAASRADQMGDDDERFPYKNKDCGCLRYYCECPHDVAVAIRALARGEDTK